MVRSLGELARDAARRFTAAGIDPAVAHLDAVLLARHVLGCVAAPMIPFLTEPQLESVLEAAREAGAQDAGYVLLRLPHEVRNLFAPWLQHHYPLKAAHVMSLVRQMRGGADNDPAFGSRMTGQGVLAELIARRFGVTCGRVGLNRERSPKLDCSRFRPPAPGGQLRLPL